LDEIASALGSTDVVALIDYILSSRCSGERVLKLLAHSYVHPNGFAKIALPFDGCEDRVRLHCFPAQSTESDVHNHRWPFVSLVLFGSMRLQHFTRSATGVPVQEYRHVQSDDRRMYQLVSVGSSHIEKTFDVTLRAGSNYVLSPEVLHRATVGSAEGRAITLVSEGAQVSAETNVFSFRGRPTGAHRSTRFGESEFRGVLTGILADLSASGPS
jgi:hypothetical protein